MTTLLLGYGISGQGCARLLEKRNISYLIYDDKKEAQEKIKNENRSFFSQKDFDFDFNQIIVSPGIQPTHHILLKAKQKNIPLVSDIEFALTGFPGRCVGITGTNGKTTTCHMLHFLLTEKGIKTKLTGNYGYSISDAVLTAQEDDILIIELSSYQLYYMEHFKALACAFVNFNDDHLDWHLTRKNYFLSKWRIFTKASPNALRILSPSVLEEAKKQLSINLQTEHFVICDGQKLKKQAQFFLTDHDYLNAEISATLASKLTGETPESFYPLFEKYKKLPHRFEIFHKKDGFLFINDSKGTNVDATLAALQSLKGPAILFLGGVPKEDSFRDILKFQKKITRIIAFGQAKDLITRDLCEYIPTKAFPYLKDALFANKELLQKTNAHVLFSPACASLDEFSNYQERGDFFMTTVFSFFAVSNE